MKKLRLPKTDSIHKLAEFWDTHDLTDFEDQLQEVDQPVFVRQAGERKGTRRTAGGARGRPSRSTAISVPLNGREARAVERLAQHRGVSPQELVRTWVRRGLASRRNGR